jgi:DNA-binding transcriptional LysR family regulator
LKRGELLRVLDGWRIDPTPGSMLYAITLPSRYMPPQVRAFVSYLKEQVRLHRWEGLAAADMRIDRCGMPGPDGG